MKGEKVGVEGKEREQKYLKKQKVLKPWEKMD